MENASKELETTIREAKNLPDLADLTNAFEKYCKRFTEGAAQLLFKRNQGPDYFLADATLFWKVLEFYAWVGCGSSKLSLLRGPWIWELWNRISI